VIVLAVRDDLSKSPRTLTYVADGVSSDIDRVEFNP
jgi:hypothetical protein